MSAVTLDVRDRRLATYLYVADALVGADVVDLGASEIAFGQFLLEEGARRALLVSPRAKALSDAAVELVADSAGLAAQSFDVAFVLGVAPADFDRHVAEARRLVKQDGLIVVAARSSDCPGVTADEGLSYYEFSDRLQVLLGPVKMVGQAPFYGTTLLEYGNANAEPMLDGRLAGKGERVQWYVALAGERRSRVGGYGVIQLVAGAIGERMDGEAKTAPDLSGKLRAVEGDLSRAKKELEDLKAKAAARAQGLEEREREARKQLASAQGTVLRLEGELKQAKESALVPSLEPVPPTQPVPPAIPIDAELAALRAENEKLKVKEAEARSEAWQHLKARSDAEATAAELREDTVRKLKDARKIAQGELMRAIEEAGKKAVSLRDDLNRTERERKELLAETRALKAEAEQEKAQLESARSEAAQLRKALGEAESTLGQLQSEHAQLRAERDALSAKEARGEQPRAPEPEPQHFGWTLPEATLPEFSPAEAAPSAELVALQREVADVERRRREIEERLQAANELLKRVQGELEQTRSRSRNQLQDSVTVDALQEDWNRLQARLIEVEEEAIDRGEAALRARLTLRDRERENEALRRELRDRDARIVAFENQYPPQVELVRIEAELSVARADLQRAEAATIELQGQLERTRAAATHERARADRLSLETKELQTQRQTLRAHLVEAERQIDALVKEKELLQQQRGNAHGAENGTPAGQQPDGT